MDPDDVGSLITRGQAANTANHPAEAERLLSQVVDRLSRASPTELTTYPSVHEGCATVAEARVRALLSLSTALVETEGPAVAIATVDKALSAVGAVTHPGHDALVAMCHSQLAILHGRAGRTNQALAELEHVATHLDSLGARERLVLHISRGMLLLDAGAPERAAQDFAAAAELAAEHEQAHFEMMARHNLGIALALTGDLPGALATMLRAERLPVDISLAAGWHSRALVLMDAGLVEEGVELLHRAIQGALEAGQHLEAGQALVALAAGQLLLGDHDGVRETARRAVAELDRRVVPGHLRRAELVQLQASLAELHDLPEVARRGAALGEEFEADGDAVAADLARLVAAEAESRRGRHTEALDLLSRSADLTRVGSISTRLRSRAVLAAADRDRGRVPAARAQVRAALHDLAGALSLSSSLELRAAALVHGQELARLDVELAGTRPAQRLAAAERWREVAGQLPTVRPPQDPELARALTELRQLGQQLDEDPSRAAELRQQLRSLERQVAATSWSASGQGPGVIGTVSLTEVRDELRGRGASAVYLVEQDARLGAVVVDRRRTRWVDLGPLTQVTEAARRVAADVEARTRVSGGPLVTAVEAALRSSLRALDGLVLRPLDVQGRVVVVPVPALSGVPWGLLPSRAGEPTTVAPSLGTWLRGIRAVERPRVSLLAGPGLPAALEECASVAPVWDVPAPHGLSRTVDLADALTDADLVHVAAHGSHRSDSPLFSSLWLDDGPLFLTDLERMRHSSSHVVVSACEAGRVRARGGAATLGLASGLLSLGVSSVVAAPCRVPDATAAALMPAYHRHLARGRAVDEALAAAGEECHLPLAGAFVAWGSPWSVRAAGA